MGFAIIPFVAFGVAFMVGAALLTFFMKRTKISQIQTQYGMATHVESPIGELDMHPEGKLDARLSAIPLYPGAMPMLGSSAEEVTEIHFRGRILKEISARYWTPDSEEQVWEFYRQQLPEWPRNLDQARGKELIRAEPDGVRLVRILREQDRTVIETSIKPVGYPNLLEYRN